jgi:hypothetical protein
MTFTPTDYNPYDFANRRHIGPSPVEMAEMLTATGVRSLDELIDQTVPPSIRQSEPLTWAPLAEHELLARMKEVGAKNRVMTQLIGQGYYGTVTPPAIQRNILENPAWYTAYTPYQPEIAQGRLEALLNFQTMVCDLTGSGRRECLASGRGDGGGGSDDDGRTGGEVEGESLFRRPLLPSADHRGDPHPGHALGDRDHRG